MDFSALLGNLCGGELTSDNLGGGVEEEVDLRGGQVHLLQTVGQAGDSSAVGPSMRTLFRVITFTMAAILPFSGPSARKATRPISTNF